MNLPAGAPGGWTDTPLEVTLPRAGTYELDADVRGRLIGNAPFNSYIVARLWDATSGAEVPQSERLVYQIIDNRTDNALDGGNATAPISELIKVTGPTTIRLQAEAVNSYGAASTSQIYSDSVGYTALSYDRVGP
ncbi:hypothetical protein DN069_13785 [Streptacidiphilus pinicola]|uniref:Uncharacterized protein n=1 Tax=Streptacidiphilus pinicola TaxID=2219663 RepID=A0A2X0J465_9ACTN|nr:hypothetical protein [Streptacidiphilus pinicola]RAG85026.1 hypothetical protein DN069_13785 [Streptacidiphilus pinicola]